MENRFKSAIGCLAQGFRRERNSGLLKSPDNIINFFASVAGVLEVKKAIDQQLVK